MNFPSRKRPRQRLEEAITSKVNRPFPSTTVLVALSSSHSSSVIPLLRGLVPEDEIEEAQEEDTNIASIDNPRKSTLTKGQHERYLALKKDSQKARWAGHQRREYRNLQGLVAAEQKLYQQAKQEFLVLNEERFLTGFSAGSSTEYATWHSKHTQAYAERWKTSNLPLSFGKVRQVVSLSQYDDTTTWMPSEVFESEVLERGKVAPIESDILTTLPPMKLPVVPPFLRDDEQAMKLAKEHGAAVIASAEALEHILTQQSWKIPLWNSRDGAVCILDEPLPHPTLPRSCLTKGAEFALRGDGSFGTYTLLTVNVRGKAQQIVIRGPSSSRRRVRVHLEYFAERATEQLSSEDISVWILDSLMDPLGSMQMVRVDVKDWSMQQAETVSVAHALASGNDVMEPWKRLLLLMNALDSMPKNGDYLLSCQDRFVSLHRANDKDSEIDLEEHFKIADAVKTSSTALGNCARHWKWNDKTRVEDTFPINIKKKV